MKVIWAILCQSAVVDQDSNQISLFNIIDELTFSGAPPVATGEPEPDPILVPMDMELVVVWARSDPETPESVRGRTRLVGLDRSEILTEEREIGLDEAIHVRWFHDLTDIPYLGEGEYLLKVDAKTPGSDWQEMFELPLWVSIQTEDP